MSDIEDMRIERAKIILSRENAIQRIDRGLYTIRSQSGVGIYRIKWNGKQWTCNCPDYIKFGHIRPCKHVHALLLYFESKEPIKETNEPELEPITYPQNWTAYNQAQCNEIELFDELLYHLVSMIETPKQDKPGRPRMELQDKLFCCIMKTYSQLSSRRAKCLYEQALQRQQIKHSPHFNMVSKTLNKKYLNALLQELIRISAQPVASIESNFAIDSSGFRCSTHGEYCKKAHGTVRMQNWLKVHICTGVNTNIVTDVIITNEHRADSPQFKKLIKNTARNFGIHDVSADMAYCSRANYQLIEDLGGEAFIPFRKNTTPQPKGSKIWRKTFFYFQFHKEEFMKRYHKRSNVESTFAAIKKKFGESIKSKNRIAQENEMLCKIIAYNITALIQVMFEFGITPEFFNQE